MGRPTGSDETPDWSCMRPVTEGTAWKVVLGVLSPGSESTMGPAILEMCFLPRTWLGRMRRLIARNVARSVLAGVRLRSM